MYFVISGVGVLDFKFTDKVLLPYFVFFVGVTGFVNFITFGWWPRKAQQEQDERSAFHLSHILGQLCSKLAEVARVSHLESPSSNYYQSIDQIGGWNLLIFLLYVFATRYDYAFSNCTVLRSGA